MEKISGTLESILFTDSHSQETFAKIRIPYKRSLIVIKGRFSDSFLQPGRQLFLYGKWSEDPDIEKYFQVYSYNDSETRDTQGIINYLTSKLIKGIGPKITEKIIQKFKNETAHILDNQPERLIEIPGISQARCDSLCKQLNEQKRLRATLLFLQQYDIAIHYGIRIYKKYQEKTIEKICEDPFLLAREMEGIGFKTADLIAIRLGVPLNSQSRLSAGIQHSLKELQEDGHTCYPLHNLTQIVATLLNQNMSHTLISIEEIISQMYSMQKQNLLHIQEIDKSTYVWIKHSYLAEQTIAQDLKRILFSSRKIRSINSMKAIQWVEKNLNLYLEHSQKTAVRASFSEKIHIITGGPGTGKSTITKAILKIFEQITYKIILAAPTGKAAKRMTEITGKHAVTIHSLLQYDFKTRSFRKNHENPIDCDLIIIDESGMIDTYLLYHLLKALPDYVIIIFIGDVYQLPSVGPGNILKDIIESKKITVTQLNKIFRQVHDSTIITNAHKVNEGELPILYSKSGRKDFLFFHKDDPQEALEQIVHLVTQFVPKKYHIYSKDIQILSPMKKGILGIHNLNKVLKSALNPKQTNLHGKFYSYAVGDKVMQIRNNYNKEVFNGDIGYISMINFETKRVIVNIDGRYVPYSFSELDDLTLAYATSVHKYQGSESPCIILPIHTSHFMMLYRNLLYTAITRGKQLVVLVGTKKAIAIATKNNKVQHRCTGLIQALNHLSHPATAACYS
ncbi:SF1B family DNA helicase RecD2 [Chlamydia gallinacea]|uniref:ATP-dependent RecD2 DNA helicase n=2 Tax=Chlamydia gallinacea TaxID=1457153 RepID=A0A173DXT2_9CHLA|nr:ATP-dependent RecD-like DNA helicase [Chlamydia gallinacea]EYE60945.1 50S ribosome-binding GTPase family protein [Bacteroides fragilis str. S6L5]ANG65735.1 AAA family ATPase [Chlamydia gallinacea 08-1274/3]AQT77200.1 AAA family ATPase [Chlamydia gallinacea]MBX6680292.1 ATP-dependent RecD-like DNA helicase [Chlamydia gallinacea]MBX6687586.1 ATP-dependent RecD-like DNA helicase [Chlamydia gallinacea]